MNGSALVQMIPYQEGGPTTEYHRKFLWANGLEDRYSEAGQPTYEVSRSCK